MSRAAMEQALGALECNTSDGNSGCCVYCGTVPCVKSCEVNQAIEELRASLAKPDSAWMPIKTVPNDMAARLYRVNGFCVQGFVDATGVLCAQNDRQTWRKMAGKPTHWMPLPAHPADQTKE